MKLITVGIVSLIVLTACVRSSLQIPVRAPDIVDLRGGEKKNPPPPPPGFNQFCQARDGVLVVYVNKNGDVKARECPGITRKEKRPDGVDDPVGLPSTLGTTLKWKMKDDPDPCIEWLILGYPRFYCW